MQIVAAAVTLWQAGRPDLGANRAYAAALSAIGPDAVLLFGTTGEGHRLDQRARENLLATWSDCLPAKNLVVCGQSHDPAEAAALRDAGFLFLTPPWTGHDEEDLARYLREAGRLLLYSHPARTSLPLTPARLHRLVLMKAAPWGAKLSKIAPETIIELKTIQPDLQAWHGTDLDLAGSAQAGAAAVVSQAVGSLCVRPTRDLSIMQREIDSVRTRIARATGATKTKTTELQQIAREMLSIAPLSQ